MTTLHSHTTNIFTVEEFLSAEECASFIKFGEQMGFTEAKISFESGAQLITAIRNNKRVEFEDDYLAKYLFTRVQKFLPLNISGWKPKELHNKWRLYKYEPGQRFNMHRDGKIKISPMVGSKFSFLVYLNDNYEGGNTQFKNGVEIIPKTGMLLFFTHDEKHAGSIVKKGTKYVLRSDVLYEINDH